MSGLRCGWFRLARAAIGCALSFAFICSNNLPAQSSAWQDVQVPALRGIKSVVLAVSSDGSGAQKLGFNQTKLQGLVATQLTNGGISIHTDGSIESKPDVACLDIEIHIELVEEDQTARPLGLTYSIEAYVLDSIAAKRRPSTAAGTLGILWKSTGEHGYLRGDQIRTFSSLVKKVVHEFIEDYHAGNQASGAPVVNNPLAPINMSGRPSTVPSDPAVPQGGEQAVAPVTADPQGSGHQALSADVLQLLQSVSQQQKALLDQVGQLQQQVSRLNQKAASPQPQASASAPQVQE